MPSRAGLWVQASAARAIPGDYPWHTLSMDIMGPFPAVGQYQFIIMFFDVFSVYCVLVLSADHTTSTMARVLVDSVGSYSGIPTLILIDWGQESVGYMWEKLAKWLGCAMVHLLLPPSGKCQR